MGTNSSTVTLMNKAEPGLALDLTSCTAPPPSAVLPHRMSCRVLSPAVIDACCHHCRPVPSEGEDPCPSVPPPGDDFCCLCVSVKRALKSSKCHHRFVVSVSMIRFNRKVFHGWCSESKIICCSVLSCFSQMCVISEL